MCVCTSVNAHVYVYRGIGKTVYYYQRDVCLKVLCGGKQKSMWTDPVLLDFRHRVFNWLRDCGKPAWSKSVGSIFPTVFAQFVSLHRILVILAVFQTFSLLLYRLWWSVIFDVTVVIVWGWTEPMQDNELDTCYVCSHYPTRWPFACISPTSCTSHSLWHNSIEIKPVNNPIAASKCSRKGNNFMSLTLNQKLKMIKLCEEGTLKAEIGWKRGLMHQTASQVVNAKKKFLKEIKSAPPVNTWMMRKWNSLVADMKNVLVVWIDDQTSHNSPLNQSLIQSFTSLQFCEVWEMWGNCRRIFMVWS